MEKIETGYLIELMFLAEASIDMQFQAFMALSFAIIVASYSTKHHLATKVRFVVALLYLVAVYALLARWLTEVDRAIRFQLELMERGIDLAPSLYSPVARMVTFAFGSLVALISIFYFRKNKRVKVDESET